MLKEIELEDALENMGAQMVKEVASKTADISLEMEQLPQPSCHFSIISSGLKNVSLRKEPNGFKKRN